jgi:hypothetical protein
MEVMESSLQNKRRELFDPIRKKWFLATPEEIVRQKLLCHLIDRCHFPLEVIAVEKKLSELPHLSNIKGRIPERRIDVLCFAPQLAFPLLLIECKGVPLQEKMLAQVWGYNAFIRAPFIALINETTIWLESEKRERKGFIPSYQELIQVCKR